MNVSRLTGKLGWAAIASVGIALLAALAGVIYAGPLDPPGGVTTSTSTQQNLIFQPAGCAGFPIVISSSGSYKLAQDITGCAGADGIDISSANVTLDLDGHQVYGAGVGAVGIKSTFINTTVRNGRVLSFSTGIGMSVIANDVQNVEVYSNNLDGIDVGADSVVSDCKVYLNSAEGIHVSGSDSVVKNCNVTGNKAQGIHTMGSNDQIIDNYAADNTTGGGCADIWVDGPANVADGNTAEHSPGGCPFFISGPGSIIVRNIARAMAIPSVDYDNPCGGACDLGPITTAAAAFAPTGNVAE